MAVQLSPSLTDLSHELLCHILQCLPLQDVLSISMLCKKLFAAVSMHLRLCKSIDFCEGKIYDYMPSSITDDHMHALFKKCPHLEVVYGLHPRKVERRRLRKRSALTVPGIIEALSLCGYLKSVETSDLRLLEAVMQHLPQLKIIGHFQNRDGMFPPHASQRLKLLPYPRISSLHLIGVEVPELTAMPHLEHLHLQCVRFTKLQPFRAFLATKLKTFVMKHCMGPTMALRYLSLIIALSSSPCLSRLELVRVPLPGGLFQRAVEDSYRHSGFVNLKTLVISGCKGVFEADIGHLMIVASKNLEKVFIQPSLTRDSLFVSLSFAQCEFPKLKNIHLGFVDKLDFPGEWSNEALLSQGLAEVPDTPSSITDSGMKVISQLFPNIKSMTVSNCPHLMAMDQWSPVEAEQPWRELTDLTLQRCHCLQLTSFALFLAFLPKIEVVILNDMFREPPKGCSHVGLSAGTGLGMSSAVVSNQDEHIAVQGHQQDFELQPEDLLENDEIREFDVNNEDNPDQHFRILQQEFFDEENHVAPAAVAVQPDPMDPENGMGNVEQDIAENQIRRELNADYNPDMNDNVFQDDSRMYDSEEDILIYDDSDISIFEISRNTVPASTQTDQLPDEDRPSVSSSKKIHNKTKKKATGKSKHRKQNKKSNALPKPQMSDEEEEESQNPPFGEQSSEIHDCRSKKNESNGKQPCPKIENNCRHSKHCKKRCSTSFDPNQPSTSRGGNCIDYSCTHSASESREPRHPHSEPLSSTDDDDFFNLSDIPARNTSNGRGAVIFKSYEDYLTEPVSSDRTSFEGPMTRHRKRIMDEDVEYQSSEEDAKKDKTSKNKKKLKKSEDASSSLRCPSSNGDALEGDSNRTSQDMDVNDKGNRAVENENLPSSNAKKSVSSQSRLDNRQKVKKRKKHRHKKCRKLGKCDKSCRRRGGPVTRSRNSKSSNKDFNTVSQGTQATSADIRRSLRRQRNCSVRCKKRGLGCGSHRRSHNQVSAREQFKRPKHKCNAELHNKSTSTSDPLMEDDAVQTLRLVSETLISLTIISCGISDVVIDHCHSMTHVEVQACRILKIFQLHYCPSLKRLNISQCPKLALDTIVPDVISLIATRKLLVSFEPCMQTYFPGDMERTIFCRAPLDQSIILFHDYTNKAHETIQAAVKESLLQWMEVVQDLYHTPAFWFAKSKKKRIKSKECRNRYPYGHCLRRIHGMYTLPPTIDPSGKQWRYEILTNDNAFASAIELVPWTFGFPTPETGETYTEDTALLSMIRTEIHEKNVKMRKKITSFYIPLTENYFSYF